MIVRTSTRCHATPPGATAAPAGYPIPPHRQGQSHSNRAGEGDENCLPPELHDAIDGHSLIASEAENEVLQYLSDQPRAVVIGLRLGAHPGFGTIDIPMKFFAVHGEPTTLKGGCNNV